MADRGMMSPELKRKLYLAGAVFFFILGIIGLFLPVLQGGLFLLVSFVLFAKGSPYGRILRRRLVLRYPQWGAKVMAAESWVAGLPRRIKAWFRR